MNAIVSGRSGRALIIEGDSLKSFDVNDPTRIVPRHQADLPYLFGEAADLRILENTSLKSVERELRNDRNFASALDLTLISLDVELPRDIREEAIVELEELLATNKTLEQVEGVLYAEPLPKTADLRGALELSGSVRTRTSHKFLRRLGKSQRKISAIRRAWESIPIEEFGKSEYRDEFKALAVRECLFRALVRDLPKTSVSRPRALRASIQKLPNHEQIIREWQRRSLALMTLDVSREGRQGVSTLDKTQIRERIRALKEARKTRVEAIIREEPRKKRKSKLRKHTHSL